MNDLSHQISANGIHYWRKNGYVYVNYLDAIQVLLNLMSHDEMVDLVGHHCRDLKYSFDNEIGVSKESLFWTMFSLVHDVFVDIPSSDNPSLGIRNNYSSHIPKSETQNAPQQNTKQSDGYVYIFHYEEKPGQYKIGMTNGDVYKRLANYSTGTLDTLHLDHVIHTNNARRLEKALHKKFKDKRIKREWFALDADDVAFIKSFSDRSLNKGNKE